MWFALAAYTEPGGNVGMITETFLAKPYSATPRELQQLARVTSASGWPSVKEEIVVFGPSMSEGKPVLAKWAAKSLACAVHAQDVAYLAADGKKKALRVLVYRGCPFQIGALKAENRLSLRQPNEIRIESADGRILIPQKDSLVPFLATDSSLVYLCWNTLGASVKFLHAGTVFETDDGKYKVLKDGASTSFDETKGVILDGIQKMANQ